ncbi:glycosyltransferase family 2 protein [Vibrio astriarenae]
MKVSVVSVFYNRADMVHQSVNSLLEQEFDDYEIVLVDDGSQDETLFELKKFDSNPLVRVITHENVGFVTAINRAIATCKAKYIAIHGSGDISLPTRLAKQVHFMEENENAVAVGCSVRAIDYVSNREWNIYEEPNTKHMLNKKIFKKNVYTHGEVMYRKSTFDKVGGYRNLFRFSQDYDLWLRFANIGHLANIPDTLYERYVVANGVSGSISKRLIQSRLASIALRSAKVKNKTGVDIVDIYGNDTSLLFITRNVKDIIEDLKRVTIARLSNDDNNIRIAKSHLMYSGFFSGTIISWLSVLTTLLIRLKNDK